MQVSWATRSHRPFTINGTAISPAPEASLDARRLLLALFVELATDNNYRSCFKGAHRELHQFFWRLKQEDRSRPFVEKLLFDTKMDRAFQAVLAETMKGKVMTSEKTGMSAKARKPRFSFLDLAAFAVVLFVLFGGWHYYQKHQATRQNDQLSVERDQLAEQIKQMKASFFQSPLPDVRAAERERRPGSEVFQHEYEFTTDWVTAKIPVWEKVLAPFKGKPDVHYLEIGVYEGRSAVWMLENILTHPTARLTGVDPFLGDFKHRCFANIERSEASEKVELITGYSQVVMRELPLESYDIIYIDGSHHKEDVLEDAVLSWRLLKEGGILIFDDYLFGRKPPSRGGDAPTDVPKLAIDPFVHCFDEHLEVIHNSYQLILRKKSQEKEKEVSS